MRHQRILSCLTVCGALLLGCANAGGYGGYGGYGGSSGGYGSTAASTGTAPVKVMGGLLTNASGMTLYTFDRDPAGKSVCTGECAVRWPPLLAGPNDRPGGDYGIITREDGSRQWTYKGKPLYLWFRDQKPGDATGDGVNGVWHVVRP